MSNKDYSDVITNELMTLGAENFNKKYGYSNSIKKNNLLLIFGTVFALIGLIGGLTADDDTIRTIFIAVGSIFGAAFLLVALILRPLIKEQKKQEEKEKIERFKKMNPIAEELLHDLSFVKEVSNIIFNRDVDDLEAKILREAYLRDTELVNKDGEKTNANPNLFTSLLSPYAIYDTKEDVRVAILNNLMEFSEAREIIYSFYKTKLELYYKITTLYFSDDEVVSSLSSAFFGDSADKYHNELKEMFLWLENEKGHYLSQFTIGCDLSTEEGQKQLTKKIVDKKDTFLKFFNEWNSIHVNVDRSGKK